MSSKSLMSNIEKTHVHHTDGTYKITINGFPVVVYGVTDMKGQFHPISFMLTSHEQEEDFVYFYRSLIKQAELMSLEYNPQYMMQDACRASFNAVEKCFPDAIILMCYFHVVENIRKHKHLIDSDQYEELKSDIAAIHMAISQSEYLEMIEAT
jgi:hypothetical protein